MRGTETNYNKRINHTHCLRLFWCVHLSSHMAPWFTVTPQPAILSELLFILGAEGCAVDVYSEGPWGKYF